MVEVGTLVRWTPDGDLGVVLGYTDDDLYYLTIWFVVGKIDNSIYDDHPNLEVIGESAQPESR
jgi:hypothetical protein